LLPQRPTQTQWSRPRDQPSRARKLIKVLRLMPNARSPPSSLQTFVESVDSSHPTVGTVQASLTIFDTSFPSRRFCDRFNGGNHSELGREHSSMQKRLSSFAAWSRLAGDQGGIAVYIGQGDRITDRLPQSAGERAFWEIAAIVTTSDQNSQRPIFYPNCYRRGVVLRFTRTHRTCRVD
jgi:hypothetical protein